MRHSHLPRILTVCVGVLLCAACGGGGASSPRTPTGNGAGHQAHTDAAGSVTLWVADQGLGPSGNLNGDVTGYSVSTSSSTATEVVSFAQPPIPDINSQFAGVTDPETLGFDAHGDLWTQSQASGLLVAFTLAGGHLTESLPSGYTLAPGTQRFMAFDAHGNLWLWTNANPSSNFSDYAVGANLKLTPISANVTGFGSIQAYFFGFDRNGVLWTNSLSNGSYGLYQSFTVAADGKSVKPGASIQTGNCQLQCPFGFDVHNNLWVAVVPNIAYSIAEYTNPGGKLLTSFPVPVPPGVNAGSVVVGQLRFDPNGVLWIYERGQYTNGSGNFNAFVAFSPTGAVLTTVVMSPNAFFPDFVFQS